MSTQLIAKYIYDVWSRGADLRSEFHSPNMDSDIYKFVYISYSILACKLTHHFSAWAYVTICDGSY